MGWVHKSNVVRDHLKVGWYCLCNFFIGLNSGPLGALEVWEKLLDSKNFDSSSRSYVVVLFCKDTQTNRQTEAKKDRHLRQ